VEEIFQNRIVYSVVVPVPELSAYAGDWVIWFAETAPKPGQSPFVRPPTPLEKLDGSGGVRKADAAQPVLIRLTLTITEDGRCEGVTARPGAPAEAQKRAVADLLEWTSHPAMRDGAPVEIGAVIEIPYSANWLENRN
jgi:hypothetical protein